MSSIQHLRKWPYAVLLQIIYFEAIKAKKFDCLLTVLLKFGVIDFLGSLSLKFEMFLSL